MLVCVPHSKRFWAKLCRSVAHTAGEVGGVNATKNARGYTESRNSLRARKGHPLEDGRDAPPFYCVRESFRLNFGWT